MNSSHCVDDRFHIRLLGYSNGDGCEAIPPPPAAPTYFCKAYSDSSELDTWVIDPSMWDNQTSQNDQSSNSAEADSERFANHFVLLQTDEVCRYGECQ